MILRQSNEHWPGLSDCSKVNSFCRIMMFYIWLIVVLHCSMQYNSLDCRAETGGLLETLAWSCLEQAGPTNQAVSPSSAPPTASLKASDTRTKKAGLRPD